MKYFVDTEFIEDGKTIDLLSIAVVAEDGRELYLQSSECDLTQANAWVKDNVFPHLWNANWTDRKDIANCILAFCDPKKYGRPEFWGYYADYDWVVICQLFGTMIDLPEGWPMYCNDVKQLAVQLGDPDLHEHCDDTKGVEHEALSDARWTKRAYEWLQGLATAK